MHRRGVTLVAIPQRGSKRSVEQEQFQKSRALEQAQAFRSGVEGRAKRFDPTRHRIVKASAESLNALRTLEKGSFDGAILVNVLYSLDDPFACLTGINRLLKPNGVIGLSTTHAAVKLDPLLDSIRRYLVEQHLFNDLRADYEQLHDINKRIERDIALRYSADQYVEMVAHAGFEILRHEDFTYEGAVMLIHARKKA